LDKIMLYAPGFRMTAAERKLLDLLHAACISRNAVQFDYTSLEGKLSIARSVRPLALYCWSGTWTLAAWCETRNDFRVFRLDLLSEVTVLPRTFLQRRGQRLEDYLRGVQVEMARQKREGVDWPAAKPPRVPPASD